MKTKFNILAIVCIVIFCIAITPKTMQNDTFYTIKIGELIVNNGIDMQDHFSWHENLPYTYPHWAYDVGMYFIYNLGEITGIADGGWLFIYISTIILSCILGILIYVTSSKLSKNSVLSFFLTLLAIYLLGDFIAARAQLVTFILFLLTILFIESFLKSSKKRYLVGLVVISIVIANVHVAVWPFFFVLFLPYVVEYFIAIIIEKNLISKVLVFYNKEKMKFADKQLKKAKSEKKIEKLSIKLEKAKQDLAKRELKEQKIIVERKKRQKHPYKIKIRKKKQVKWLIIVMIICAFTGLLTPLGTTPYTYLVKTMQGNTTKSINEHQPLVLYNDLETMALMAFVLTILIFTDIKVNLRDLFMMAGLIFISFMSRRQVSLLVLIGIIILAKWIQYLIRKYDKKEQLKFMYSMTTLLGEVIIIAVVTFVSTMMLKPKMNSQFISTSKYPVKASNWILENLPVEKIKLYNEYNYGSYLLYKGIPVFIDSRADLYAPEFNQNEDGTGGKDIFSDYINISSIGTYYETKFKDYGITHVIVVNNAKLNMFLSRNDSYKQIYKDDEFVVYERKG